MQVIPATFMLATLLSQGPSPETPSTEAASQVSWTVPADFPVDLPTIVAGQWRGKALPGPGLLLRHAKLGDQPMAAQLDVDGRRVWFVAAAPSELLGETLELAAEPADSVASTMRIVETDAGFQFLEGERPGLFYQRQPVTQYRHTRAGYVHPLLGLDGEVFTEVFPADHRHHQGVFWAWHQLWLGDRQLGDPWVCRDHLVVVRETSVVDGPLCATLDVRADWTSPLLTDAQGQPQPIVEERTQIRLFRTVSDSQYVDFTIQLRALLPGVKLGGSEDEKGYSGFTVRVKPPADLQIKDASGPRTDDAVQTASSWADASGSFLEGRTSGVGILCHPSLRDFPPRWLLRHYGMQNVAYPGRQAVALAVDEPLTLRHRLVLHRGDAETARVAEHQQVYEATP